MMTIAGIIIAIAVVFYLWLNHAYKRTNHYINPNRDLQSYIKGVPKDIRLANFGTTNSYYAFKSHDVLGINSFNFALNCESVELDLDILKHYASHLAKGCIVILHLNFCVSIYRRNLLDESRKLWAVLPGKNHINVSFKQRLKHWFPISPFDIKRMARVFFDVDDNSYENRYYVDAAKAKDIAADMAKCWINLFHLESMHTSNLGKANQKEIEFNIAQIEEFIHFCQQHGFYPVIACTPFGKKLNSYVSDEFDYATLGGIESKAQKMGVPFFNYRKDERFQNELSLFMDGCYKMTEHGSKKYLKILLNDVRDFYHLSVCNQSLS